MLRSDLRNRRCPRERLSGYHPEAAAATGGSHKNTRVIIDKVERFLAPLAMTTPEVVMKPV